MQCMGSPLHRRHSSCGRSAVGGFVFPAATPERMYLAIAPTCARHRRAVATMVRAHAVEGALFVPAEDVPTVVAEYLAEMPELGAVLEIAKFSNV